MNFLAGTIAEDSQKDGRICRGFTIMTLSYTRFMSKGVKQWERSTDPKTYCAIQKPRAYQSTAEAPTQRWCPEWTGCHHALMARIWLYILHVEFSQIWEPGRRSRSGLISTHRAFVLFTTTEALGPDSQRGDTSTSQSHLSGQGPLKLKAMAAVTSILISPQSRFPFSSPADTQSSIA